MKEEKRRKEREREEEEMIERGERERDRKERYTERGRRERDRDREKTNLISRMNFYTHYSSQPPILFWEAIMETNYLPSEYNQCLLYFL